MLKQESLDKLSEDLIEVCGLYTMDVNLNISLDKVILNNYQKSQIDDFIVETKYKEKFMLHGLKPVNRMLFYGASGTGKTFLSKALTNYFDYDMLYVDIASALGSGTAADAITAVFKIANAIGKAVIFFDECDAVCWARDDKNNRDDAAIRRATNAIFQNLDQMNPECIFIAATNLYDDLDTAFKNRFNMRIRFDRPLIENLDEDFNKILLPDFSITQDMNPDIKKILCFQASNFDQLSYRAMTDWVERAEKTAIINDTLEVKESDIYKHLMEAMRLEIGYDKKGKPYLYNIS